MNCANRDSDLLLLAHGELTLWRRLSLYLHLGQCPGCRERLRRFGSVAATLTLATRPGMALAGGMSAGEIARSTFVAIGLWIAVLAVIIATGLLAGVSRSFNSQGQTVPRCAPDLESDRCR